MSLDQNLLDQLKIEKARRYLRDYTKQAWHVVEPSTEYTHGWHIDAISDHLEAVSKGEIRDLLINMPPRHMKSLSVSVFWPTWTWIDRPWLRWLFSSYADSLSIRDSLKCRRIITSPWYQRNWGDRFKLAGDQNAKSRFENDKTGYRLSTSVGGSTTGEGGDIIVVDDPHNVMDARSQVSRENALIWWDEAMSTRLNNPKTGCKVIVMQRVHEKDLSGHVLEQGGYEHLCLPCLYETDRPRVYTSIGWTDPRTVEGELLWPNHFGETEVTKSKKVLGPYGFAGQMQQTPIPSGGGLFKKDSFLYFRIHRQAQGTEETYELIMRNGTSKYVPRSKCWIFQTADIAASTKSSADYFVNGTWAVTPELELLLLDVYRNRLEGPDQKPLMKRSFNLWNPSFQAIEETTFGITLIQDMRRDGALVVPLKADKDKFARALPAAARIESGGMYFLLDAEYLGDYEKELVAFPLGSHDDQVDVTAYAAITIAQMEALQDGVPPTDDMVVYDNHESISSY